MHQVVRLHRVILTILLLEMSILRLTMKICERNCKKSKVIEQYQRGIYSVICMETGLPNKEIFSIVASYVCRLSAGMHCFYGWQVKRILLEDQGFITLMNLRQKLYQPTFS